MVNPNRMRRKAFKVALANAETTARAWCAERGITEGHLYQVLRGNRQSATLLADVDDFIAEHSPARSPV